MNLTVKLLIKENYGLDTYNHMVEETIESVTDRLLLSHEEIIGMAYDQYISRIEEGFLPLIPESLDESEWDLAEYGLYFYRGEKLKNGAKAVVYLKYNNTSPLMETTLFGPTF